MNMMNICAGRLAGIRAKAQTWWRVKGVEFIPPGELASKYYHTRENTGKCVRELHKTVKSH